MICYDKEACVKTKKKQGFLNVEFYAECQVLLALTGYLKPVKVLVMKPGGGHEYFNFKLRLSFSDGC